MWFDIICLIIVVAGLVFGYRRGFMNQMGAVAGVVLGIICCNVFSGDLAAKFSEPGDEPGTLLLNNVMSYVIIFAVCYLVGRLLGSIFSKGTRALHLGALNGLAGAAFKMAEYVLVYSILLNAWIGLFPGTELRTDYSGVKRFVLDFAPTVLGSETISEVYSSVQDAVQSTADSLRGDEAVEDPVRDN